jgi:hypothetical protein
MLLMMSENIARNMYSSQGIINYSTQLHIVGYFRIYDIFINCIWVVTRWQYTFTHKHYIEQHK